MKIRVSAVQYNLKPIKTAGEFAEQVGHQVKTAATFGSKFVLFPEYLTTQLVTVLPFMPPFLAIKELAAFTDSYIEMFGNLARKYNLHIVGGTHVVRRGEAFQNTAFLFYPDGSYKTQPKVHLTPSEKTSWLLSPGNSFETFETEYGKIAILTCYDVEFPEAARTVADKGAEIIFCPSCTDDQWGHYRVRYCCQARAIENQVYVVNTGTVGTIPVENMESNYGQAAILSPCDMSFARGGIIIEGDPNREMVVTGELDLDLLRKNRSHGSDNPFWDRRPEAYK